MSDGRRLAASLAARMRAGLARIELAASELARISASPRQGELADSLSETVGELDGLLGRLGELLVPPDRAGRREDLRPVLGALVERYAPLFAARGGRLRAGGADAGSSGDPILARRAAVALLCSASRTALPPAADLRLLQDSGRWGVELRLEGGADLDAESKQSLDRFAQTTGARFTQAGPARYALWQACEEGQWPAS